MSETTRPRETVTIEEAFVITINLFKECQAERDRYKAEVERLKKQRDEWKTDCEACWKDRAKIFNAATAERAASAKLVEALDDIAHNRASNGYAKHARKALAAFEARKGEK